MRIRPYADSTHKHEINVYLKRSMLKRGVEWYPSKMYFRNSYKYMRARNGGEKMGFIGVG